MRISTTIEWDSQEEMEQFFAQRSVDSPVVLTEETPAKKRGRPKKVKDPEPESEPEAEVAVAEPEEEVATDSEGVTDNAGLRAYVTRTTDPNQGGSRDHLPPLSAALRGAGFQRVADVPDEKCAEVHALMEAAIA